LAGAGSAPLSMRLRLSASIRSMTFGGSAKARGVGGDALELVVDELT
jgi:hypothetical protein